MPVLEMPASLAAGRDAGECLSFGEYKIIFKSPHPGAPDAWTVVDYTLPAGRPGAPPHYHRELIESFYVLDGRLTMRVGEREIDAGPGAFVYVAPGTWHSFSNRTGEPARFLAHASSPRHKDFLTALYRMAREEGQWPPRDPSDIVRLGAEYDSYYE